MDQDLPNFREVCQRYNIEPETATRLEYKFVVSVAEREVMMLKRSGIWKDNLTGELAYRSYLPTKLPPTPGIDLDKEGTALLARAHRALEQLNRMAAQLPPTSIPIPHSVKREALSSAQIEGIRVTWEEVLAKTEVPDLEPALNCIRAHEYAIQRLEELPLCNRLLREAHAILMADPEGQDKSPGQFRTTQNWVGGSTLQTAAFVPPAPEDMLTCMDDLERYMNDPDDSIDPLVKAALLHYQFETIHPFVDGNGRVGRLLITLFLLERKLLFAPVLMLSNFFKENLEEYYDRLAAVRTSGDYEQWVKFFLRAVLESAQLYLEDI